jgi:glutathione S-transferase
MADSNDKPVLIGRSSSHFTRIARIFAGELGVEYEYRVVLDITSQDPETYGGNPALKVPVLKTEQGSWFGALNVCRELARRSTRKLRAVWPEELEQPLPANAQELVVQSMSTGVTLVMAKTVSGAAPFDKVRQSLKNSIDWLEANVSDAVAALPDDRDLSFLEVSLYCLVRHLEFREIIATAPYAALNRFCDGFELRSSARGTAYRFDT